MIVAHICQSNDANIGGSLVVARALIRAQRSLGIDARLVCLYDSGSTEGGEATDEFCQVSRHSRWLLGIPTLRAKLRKLSPAIIHHHDGLLWPRIATAGLGIPLVTHGHLGRPQTGWTTGSYWTHRYVAAHTDRLIAISPWVADSWADGGFPREQIRLVPNGVDCERFYPRGSEFRQHFRSSLGLPTGQRVLLWAGRLDRVTKGLDRLISTVKMLPKEVTLVIAGDGPSREWFEQELNTLDLANRPLIMGKVDDPAELFGIVDGFLFTSKIEPFGLVLLEAAASGLPLYAFRCDGGGMNLLLELQANVFGEDEVSILVKSFATHAPNAASYPAERVRLNYSWDAAATSLKRVYEDLAAECR